MKTKVSIFTNDWCNLVFEGRNREYGAYAMRVESGKQKMKALFIAVALAMTIAIFPMLSKKLLPDIDVPVSTSTVFTPIDDEGNKPPREEDLPKPLPRPMMAYTAPVITNDRVQDEMHTVEELLTSPAVIGTHNLVGDPNSIEIPQELLATGTVDNTIYTTFEKEPQLPQLMEYLKNNLNYPALALELGISGRVYIEFVVEKQGEITDVRLVRGIGGGCDEEALRVVKAMPKWHPGMMNGHPIRVRYTIPVVFKLQEQ